VQDKLGLEVFEALRRSSAPFFSLLHHHHHRIIIMFPHSSIGALLSTTLLALHGKKARKKATISTLKVKV